MIDKANIISQEVICNKIYYIRAKKVMLDRDLASMYGVTTKAMNQAVKRNRLRFPEDFIFQLSTEEFKNWKSQIVTSNNDRMGLRKRPYAFTENGIAMLSSVLKSKRAIYVNIEIMRTFTKIREIYSNQREMFFQMNKHEIKLLQHDKQISSIFKAIEEIHEIPRKIPKRKIGFLP
jgi:hypothetical protein